MSYTAHTLSFRGAVAKPKQNNFENLALFGEPFRLSR
jgi:hypothetical protein